MQEVRDGIQDAKDGVEHESGHGDTDDCDYANQYELEQILTHRSEQSEHS